MNFQYKTIDHVSQADTILSPSLISIDDERWIRYLVNNPLASTFHHPQWLHLLAASYGYIPHVFIEASPQGEIKGAIPLIKIKNRIQKERWVSLPFTDHCAPLTSDDSILPDMISDLLNWGKENNNTIELRWGYPDHPQIYKKPAYLQHKIRLAEDESDVWKHINDPHRRWIKKAVESGIRIECGHDIHFMQKFYRLQLLTRRRKGLPVQPWSFFELFTQYITQPGLGFILLAFKDDDCVAGDVFLNWNKTLIYKYSASKDISRKLHASFLLLWTAIQWGCKNNYDWLDLGRSDREDVGLREFKRRWGSIETPLPYSIISANLPKSMSKNILSIMNTVIKKSPLWVCRLAGEFMYRYSG